MASCAGWPGGDSTGGSRMQGLDFYQGSASAAAASCLDPFLSWQVPPVKTV